MNPNLITIGWANIIAAVTIFLLSLPLIFDQVPRNRFYGIRIPIAFRSEQHWTSVNVYGGKVLAAWSIPILIVGVYAGFISTHHPNAVPDQSLQYWLLTFAAAIAVILATLQILLWSRTLK